LTGRLFFCFDVEGRVHTDHAGLPLVKIMFLMINKKLVGSYD